MCHEPASFCSGGGSGAAALANDVLLLVMRCCMDAPVVAKQWMLQGYQARRMPLMRVVTIYRLIWLTSVNVLLT